MLSVGSLKERTKVKLQQAVDSLLDYPQFSRDTLLDAITRGDAKEWRSWVGIHGNRKGKTSLADNTLRRRTGLVKQIFAFANRPRLANQKSVSWLTLFGSSK